jgi:soluble lytic murein transglycosylase-like protein
MTHIPRRAFVLTGLAALAACSRKPEVTDTAANAPLYPGETPQIRALINHYADLYDLPRSLVHRVVQRESNYNPNARNGPYYGLMQILPQTAATMGHTGPASQLLDPDVNLRFGVKYLRGAWLVSGGDPDAAISWYARGYYYEAKRLGLLKETGLI